MKESNLSPPAPLDLGRMEAEAKTSATKHISNLLQRPDQLEKVDQYKRRVTRKKASVDTMLKTAVQSQLDGVRTGLNQLQSALQDVYEIKQGLDEVEETYKTIQPLYTKLKGLRDENRNFCQLATAMENLKHIFTVPESVSKTKDLIAEGKLLQAHKYLTDLETSRDDLMFELFKQPQQSPTDNQTLKKYFAEVETLSESLGKQLWIIIQRVILSVRREPTLIVTALRIIEREERVDVAVLKRQEETGFLPTGRPKKWRDKCFQVLQDSICQRIEGNQIEDRSINKMWLVRHLELNRQLMIEDLKVVKTLLPPIFPPEYGIVNRYVKMYHRALSNHLQEMIAQELEGNEFVTLLTWVNSYYSPELMKHPELNIDTSELGPLLENNVIDQLQNQYLKNMKLNIMEWMRNSLVQDKKDWERAEHPDADGDGFYSTSLPVIIFQMMEQNLQVAQMMGEELVKKVVELFAQELKSFSKDYYGEIQKYKDKHMLDRGEPKFFLHYMIANTNNCLVFGEYLKQLRKRYLKEELGQDEEEIINIRKDRFQLLTDDFIKMGHDWTKFILDEVSIDLRDSKSFEDLMTKQWMQSGHSVEIICCTWADYHGDFVHLKPVFYNELVEHGKRLILKEYLKALLNKKLSFKAYDDRKNAAEKICKEADQLKDLFLKYGGPGKTEEKDFVVLQNLAEVLKLRDTSMLSLELMGLMKNHPDISMEHLINLLLIRGDMSRSEARQMVQDIFGETPRFGAMDKSDQSKPRGIFAEIAIN